MVELLLNGGIQSFTLWGCLLAFGLLILAWIRRTRLPQPDEAPVANVSTSWIVLAVVALGTCLNLSYGLYRAYIAPRDILQDIVSAQEFLAGRTLYPDKLNVKMREAMEAEPPRPSPVAWSSSLQERENNTRERVFTEKWVQAHPPTMTLCFAPFVYCLGVLGTQIAFLILSFVALGLSVWLIQRELQLTLNWRQWLMVALALLGADPIVDVLRLGQSGLILGLLMVLGWVCLRRDRPLLAGVCIGLATGLKLYPGLLLIYLAVKHPRAFLSALLTLAGMVVLVGVCAGWHTFGEYYETAHGVSQDYQTYPANVSMLGLFSRFGAPADAVIPPGRALFVLVGGLLVGGMIVIARRGTLDAGYSMCVALMPILSPISWDHYLSVLVLPLFVLGQFALTPTARWRETWGFLALLIVLAIPETSFTWVYEHLDDYWNLALYKLLLLPLRTYAVLVIVAWLGWPVWSAALPGARPRVVLPLLGMLALLMLAHGWAYVPSEPYYNNDETRHVMTGVFFRDALVDQPTHPREYAYNYYLQYPALGLLVWPPLFYLIEGAFMLAAGTSFVAAKVLVLLFAALACVALYRLVARTHDVTTAFFASCLMGLSPLVFEFSHQVMLEVPTLAFVLCAVERCQRYLESSRRWDLALCCLATAAAALCRFDGIVLAPLYLIWLVGARQWGVLRRPAVWVAGIVSVALVAPAYVLSYREMGGAHLHAASEGTSAASTGFLAPSNFVFYPQCIPEQIGWGMLVPVVMGFLVSLISADRARCWPYFAMVGGTYLTFTPLAEVESRHAIYWVPALAFFAARGLRWLPATWAQMTAAVLVIGSTLATSLSQPVYYVRGYEEAAAYTVAHNNETPVCLMEGFLNGDFIYQTRRHDPARRLTVLRGDKLFYVALGDKAETLRVDSKDKVLVMIQQYDPEYIIIEEPQIYTRIRGPELVREALRDEQFELVHVVRIETNHQSFDGRTLKIYRNTKRNSNRETPQRL